MAVGDSNDLLARVKRELPSHWFNQAAPIRDAILGGLSDLGAWLYSFLYYAYAQMRLATASGPWLDLFANDFLGLYLTRRGASDAAFRATIKATILQERVTRAGMSSMLKTLTGSPPIIFEPWNTGDTGGWDMGLIAWAGAAASSAPAGGWDAGYVAWDQGASGWDITSASYQAAGGAGGWGATTNEMPAQVLITVPPSSIAAGVPNVAGWDGPMGGWDQGAIEWVDDQSLGELTEADIYAAINATKPTGVIAWTDIQ